VKKGRHRRYEEARKFHRDLASSFSVEDFDLDAPDPFSLPDTTRRGDHEDSQYADLAEKYADDDGDDGDDEEY
jgi:hypothetical protein